jgi:hypothetical protein
MTQRQRCVNLRDWQSRALLGGASALVVPVPGVEGAVTASWWIPTWQWVFEWTCQLDGSIGRRLLTGIAPGDALVGREAWQYVYSGLAGPLVMRPRVRYRAGGEGIEFAHMRDIPDGTTVYLDSKQHPWRTPQHMPARLARHRKQVRSVEPVLVRKIPSWVWEEAGGPHNASDVLYDERAWAWMIGLEVGT